jgi:hypothetical protein
MMGWLNRSLQKINLYTGTPEEGTPPLRRLLQNRHWQPPGGAGQTAADASQAGAEPLSAASTVELTIDENSCEFDGMKVEEAEERLKDTQSELPDWRGKSHASQPEAYGGNSADWENPTALETAELGLRRASFSN